MKRIPLNKADYYETFPAYLDGISRKFGEKPAITYFTRKQEAVTASYAQLTQQALCAAHALQARGYAGKHLAIVAENSYDWLVAYLAIASAGAAAVCIDVEQSDENIRQMIAQADAVGVFASETYLPICRMQEDGTPAGWNLFFRPHGGRFCGRKRKSHIGARFQSAWTRRMTRARCSRREASFSPRSS